MPSLVSATQVFSGLLNISAIVVFVLGLRARPGRRVIRHAQLAAKLVAITSALVVLGVVLCIAQLFSALSNPDIDPTMRDLIRSEGLYEAFLNAGLGMALITLPVPLIAAVVLRYRARPGGGTEWRV
jgi:hypothetical protein